MMTAREYHDLLNRKYDEKPSESEVIEIDNKIREYNQKLIEKYPWLLPRNEKTDRPPYDYDYSYTELDGLPKGWRVTFGDSICEEIQSELEKFDYVDKYRIRQIKEKFGSLRWYDDRIPKDCQIPKIIRKYEELSETICICCGAPATKRSTRYWVSYYCDKHANNKYEHYVDIKEEENAE